MYPSGRRSAPRLPANNFMNLKTVEVGRGRNGYGFTIAGQNPCILSCIMPSSPAELATLKPGDCVIAVNGENVTRLSHEQFIKLIGETTGVLRLTVADLATEEMSDEEYYDDHYRGGGSFPRARSSTPGGHRTNMVLEELNSGALFHAYPARKSHYTQHMYYGSNSNFNSRVSDQDKFAPGHLSPFNRSGQSLALRNNAQAYEHSYWNGQGVAQVDRVNKPKRKRDQRQRAASQRSYFVQEDPFADDEDEGDTDTRPLTSYELNNIAYPSMTRASSQQPVTTNHFDQEDSSIVRVVVGYLGSVDIPAAANLPTASLQAIRSCVRRLRIEQRIHSLMMMHISPSGIKLLNANNQVTVTYPANKIVFSGICPDDKRCFGVVTVQNANSSPKAGEDEEAIGSACHVFIVDPELSSHDMHEEISAQFDINCVPNPENHTCPEYPASSRVVLHHVSQFYQDKQDNSKFGDFFGQAPYTGIARRSNSGSSNSDSGFGNGERGVPQSNGSDQIVDVASHIRNQRANRKLPSMQNQVPPVGLTSQSSHNINFALNDSMSPTSSEMSPSNYHPSKSNLEDKLTPRARPDPVPVSSRPSYAVPPTLRAESVNIFDMGQSSTLLPHQRDSRRLPQRPLPPEAGWKNGGDFLLGSFPSESNMYGPVMGRPPPRVHQMGYLNTPSGMTTLRRGSDCSDYNTSYQTARQNALKKMHARRLQELPIGMRESLTASDGELNAIDDPLRHDGNTASQADLAEEKPPEIGRVSGWAVSFERLLKDELGLAYFTGFLKQEFSEENILFWIACEKLSKVTDKTEIHQKADGIYHRYLSPHATMAVNLEGDYRQMVEKSIKNPSPEMFKDQQLQIFKLMKLDSYSRFLKSKLYQDCVLSEMGSLPMPTIEVQSITELGSANGQPTDPSSETDKNKKKKADKLGNKKLPSDTPDSPQRQISEEKRKPRLQWFRGITGRRAGSQRDDKDSQFYVSSPQQPQLPVSQSETKLARGNNNTSPTKEMLQRSLSQFITTLPNNVTLPVKIVPDRTIGEVLLPLCEEHGLTQQTAEIFVKSTKELVDLHQDLSVLAGKEVVIERRVIFKIELPNKRLIGVKSKPTKKLIEVLRPVTYKYELQLDALVVHLSNSPIPLDVEITVAALDNQRIMIETIEQYSAGDVKSKSNNVEEPRAKSVDSVLQPEEPIRSPGSGDPPVNTSLERPPTKPAVPTVQENNNNHRGNLRLTDDSDLYRLVAKANRRRLDDQRGLTIRNLDLPDFLIQKQHSDNRPASCTGFEMEQNYNIEGSHSRLTEIPKEERRSASTPPRPHLMNSWFMTGTIPSHEEADEVFGRLQDVENISFGNSLGSSGYPDSLANTTHSFGDGKLTEQYRLPEDYPSGGEDTPTYNPKMSGISITSEIDIPQSPSCGLDVTLTTNNVEDRGPQITSNDTPLFLTHNNNHLKTLYEESMTDRGVSKPVPQAVVAKKPPSIAPKPHMARLSSLPTGTASDPKSGIITVVGADGRTHRATFV